MGPSSREAVDRVLDAVQRMDAGAYAGLFAEDGTLQHPLAPEPIRGRVAIRNGEQALFDSFSDVDVQLVSLTSDQARAVAEVVLRATNTGAIDLGDGGKIPATGRRIEVAAVWIFDFDTDGLVLAERDYFDTAALMAQLGIEP